MKAVDLLEPGRLLSGALFQEIVDDQAPSLPQGSEVGVYRIVSELGRGGMGRVYLAERADGEYQQQVALKVLARKSGAISAELFRRERQTLVGLRHANIARMIDGGHDASGQPWLAMELIQGNTLDRHCRERRLPITDRLRLFLDVCQAVAFAHARGVLHRDIKPNNAMVDADGRAKLLDFGIAEMIGQSHGSTTAFTPGYASPEQRAGAPATVASDVFQLGRLLAALLNGVGAERHVRPLAPVDHATPQPPLDLPVDLERILRCATAVEPERRYATANAMIEDIEAFLGNRPLRAYRDDWLYASGLFLRRHRPAAAIGGFLLLLILAGALYSSVRIAQERARADERARVASSTLSFLQEDLLSAASPMVAQGRELSVREALDQASAHVAQRFRNAPIEQQAIRISLARLYDDLGLADQAITEASAALQLKPASIPGAEARLLLAALFIAQDRLDAAQSLLDEPVDPESPPSSDWQWEHERLRALILRRRGDYAAAVSAFQTLESKLARAMPNSDVHRTTLKNLSESLSMQGQQEQALRYLEQVCAADRNELGERHPVTLSSEHDRATLLRHLGNFDEALSSLQSVAALRRQVLGNRHPETLRSLSEQATVLQELHRRDEAEVLFKEVMAARLEVLGEVHIETRNSMSNLGLLYSLWGRLDQAASLYERVLAIELPLSEKPHPDTIALMHNIAGLYRKQGRIEAALAMHRSAIAAAIEVIGGEAWQTGMFHIGRAQTLQAAKRYDESEIAFNAGIHAMTAALGSDHARVKKARALKAAMQAEHHPDD